MAPFLDSNPKEVIAALSSGDREKGTLDVDASSLVGVEEVEGDLGSVHILLSHSVLGPGLHVEAGLGRGSGRLVLGLGGTLLDLAHQDILI